MASHSVALMKQHHLAAPGMAGQPPGGLAIPDFLLPTLSSIPYVAIHGERPRIGLCSFGLSAEHVLVDKPFVAQILESYKTVPLYRLCIVTRYPWNLDF